MRKRTGLVIDPYFSGTKLRWILDHVDGARERAARGELAFGTIDSWLVWQLTRGRLHVTDVSNASRTLLWDIHTGQWDADLMRALDIHPSLLPEVHPSAHRFGQTDADWLGAPLTIGGIAGDQQSALFGQACFKPGMAKNTYGTGCFMLLNTGERAVESRNGLISTAACQSGSRRSYALEGSVFVGGAVVQWLRDGLRAIQRSADVEGSPPRCRIRAAWCSCPRSPDWGRRTGTRPRRARSSGCRAARPSAISRGRRWSRSRSRAPRCCRR